MSLILPWKLDLTSVSLFVCRLLREDGFEFETALRDGRIVLLTETAREMRAIEARIKHVFDKLQQEVSGSRRDRLEAGA